MPLCHKRAKFSFTHVHILLQWVDIAMAMMKITVKGLLPPHYIWWQKKNCSSEEDVGRYVFWPAIFTTSLKGKGVNFLEWRYLRPSQVHNYIVSNMECKFFQDLICFKGGNEQFPGYCYSYWNKVSFKQTKLHYYATFTLLEVRGGIRGGRGLVQYPLIIHNQQGYHRRLEKSIKDMHSMEVCKEQQKSEMLVISIRVRILC